ncbi:nucleoside 2-deoxyribosyltransferase [Streptomyces sp. NPDC053048]|uniref:nucleoside 2-deoxyribosyltransferase n=1 Tax=Streptomyces sp. NPDC053048 TaxID=3365694 RepID=UPI0037D3F13E
MTLTHSDSTPEQAPGSVRSVFLAGPFMGLLDPATGEMPDPARTPFALLIRHFEQQGLEVYNAHRREMWGAELMAPDQCTALDQKEIEKADVFVALPGAPASPGTHIEIGWASAFGKPIVLLLEEGAEYAFLVRGLRSVATVEYVRYTDLAGALADVDAAVRRAVSRREAALTDV